MYVWALIIAHAQQAASWLPVGVTFASPSDANVERKELQAAIIQRKSEGWWAGEFLDL